MIQLALTDAGYRASLSAHLQSNGSGVVSCVDSPDLDSADVLVLDPEHLENLPHPIDHPERIVLIAGNRSADLSAAWEAGLQSVVLRDDPMSTAVLAVLSARLQYVGLTNSSARRNGNNGLPRVLES